jgi:hypothetical protein
MNPPFRDIHHEMAYGVRRRSVRVTDLNEQALAAEFFLKNGGQRTRTLAGAIGVTGKRARKLIKAARRANAQEGSA